MLDSCPLHAELQDPTSYQAQLHAAHLARRQRFSQAAQACLAKLETAHEATLRRAANAATIKKLQDNMRQARQEIRALKLTDPTPLIRAKAIVSEIAERHAISVAEIYGERRAKHIIDARHEAMAAVVASTPEWSLAHIARHFNKDHSSLLHVLKKQAKQETAS